MKAKVNWIKDYHLEGETDTGQKVIMDLGPNAIAAHPAQLVLHALAGCTMMDIVLILTKSRKKLEKFWVDVEAEEAKEHPKVFTKIHLVYNIKGNFSSKEIERAIEFQKKNTAVCMPCSKEKCGYCPLII